MYTKLHSMPDWQEALRGLELSAAPTDADTDAAVLRELSRGRVSFAETDAPAAAGCRVTLRTSSALPKFNREKTVLTVGSGLFSPEIEALLPGMRAGESASAAVKGEIVDFTVTRVERRVYPELTDELVRAQNIGGVDTLAGYREYMADKLRREYAASVADALIERLAAAADMDAPDERDIGAVTDREYEPLRERFSHGGEDIDKLSEEQWTENFYRPELKAYYESIYPDIAPFMDTKSKADYYEKRRPEAIRTIRECLVLGAALGRGEDPTADRDALKTLRGELISRICKILQGDVTIWQ